MKAYLILADGSIFEGQSAGAFKEVIGEAVFITTMGGYIETLTDPNNYGQIVIQTFPLMGNYGMIDEDTNNIKPCLTGYIAREICDEGSNFRKDGELNDYLERNQIPSITGIDTRELTRQLRDKGIMNAMISDNIKNLADKLKEIKKYSVKGAAEATSTSTIQVCNESGDKTVVVVDMGAVGNIIDQFIKRDCKVIRVPFNTSAAEISKLNPDGVVISGGGGVPRDYVEAVNNITKLVDAKMPVYGIGLGHQLLGLSQGLSIKKLKYGHRGTNQPIKDFKTGRVLVSAQNHGYVIKSNGIDESVAKISFINANDRTVEGIEYLNIPAFGTQFYPEANGGPLNTDYMYDKFILLMRGERNA